MEHAHHWKVETPAEAAKRTRPEPPEKVRGWCGCGERREFDTAVDELARFRVYQSKKAVKA